MKIPRFPWLCLLALPLAALAAEPPKYNVLHIISDDLAARLGCYGDPMVQSPNIDALAKKGVRFEHAYCQYPLCNPSRSSFMTGLRPDTTQVYGNGTQFRENVADAVTIPQSFQKAGYSAARVGKIYHYGVPAQIGTDGLDDPVSWEEHMNPKGRDIDDIGMVEVLQLGKDGKAETTTGKQLQNTGATLSWLAAEGEDTEQTDGKIADTAIQMLTARAQQTKPFYLAVGFFRPHTPYISPKKYFAMYPPEKVKLPVVPANFRDLFPKAALATLRPEELAMDDALKRKAIQAYDASTSFMDAQVGRVLAAVDKLGLREKTIIVFHSDHGYHLGDKNLWQKMTIYENAARVPLIISVPGGVRGQTSTRPVELVDLHKTLTDLCGISAGEKTQGHSLKPLVQNPAAPWDFPAYSQVQRGAEGKKKEGAGERLMGRSVRTERWRYTEWGTQGAELYDHESDPAEMKNLANDPAAAGTLATMKKLLATPRPMKRLALLTLLVLAAAAGAAEPSTPNVIVILSDDYGYGSAGCYGADGTLVQTPNIDRLAKEGRRFLDANTASSVCSPTRYALMTGRYCWRTSAKSGVLSTFAPLHIETTRLTMASLLKNHGYHTAAIGKWHLGYGTADGNPNWRPDFTAELSPGPLDIGFDYHFGVPSNHGDLTGVFVENRYVYGLKEGKIPAGMKLPGPQEDSDNFQADYTKADTENGQRDPMKINAARRKNDRVMPELTDKVVHWLDDQRPGTPFFLYYTPVTVHNPVTPEKELAGKSKAGLYGDWIQQLDRSVGKVLEALDRLDVAKNTIVIFSSDNGGVFEPRIANSPQTIAYTAGLKVNGALKGGKHHIWEGGFKVPFIVRWPGHVPPGTTSTEMLSLADLLATTAAIVGDKLPPADKAAEDSYNMLPAFLGESKEPIRPDMIVHSSDGVFAIRRGPWKWIEGVPAPGAGKPAALKLHADENKPQLYNTKEDPAETKDVAAEHPEIVTELKALLTRYRNGGYSRELPPVVEAKTFKPVAFPAPTGEVLLKDALNAVPVAPWSTKGGVWKAHDGAFWGAQQKSDANGVALHVPIALPDGIIQYELTFHGPSRHSLRVEAGQNKESFRIEIAPDNVGLTINPPAGGDKKDVMRLARQALELKQDVSYPVRISFKGNQCTVEIAGASITGTHPLFAAKKTALNLLVFGDGIGFKNVVVAKQ